MNDDPWTRGRHLWCGRVQSFCDGTLCQNCHMFGPPFMDRREERPPEARVEGAGDRMVVEDGSLTPRVLKRRV